MPPMLGCAREGEWPAARCMAPATPPPVRNQALAAFTTESMSDCPAMSPLTNSTVVPLIVRCMANLLFVQDRSTYGAGQTRFPPPTGRSQDKHDRPDGLECGSLF